VSDMPKPLALRLMLAQLEIARVSYAVNKGIIEEIVRDQSRPPPNPLNKEPK
jgi:hypothetical protein